MEFVDVIDELGNIIESVNKLEAHEKGLLHKTVVTEVIDSKGRMLLVRQSAHKQEPGKFVSPMGGHISAGESEMEALKREVKEELGYEKFNNYKRLGQVHYYRLILGRIENHLFTLYEVYQDEDPILDSESMDFKWFTKEELRNRLRNNPEDFGDAFFVVVKNFYPELIEI